jgi:hypothetical protein
MKLKNTMPMISLAEVRNRVNPAQDGSFWAKINVLDNSLVSVYYTSPYASNGAAAFIAIPEEGTEILVCKPVGSSQWYYMGATFAPLGQQVDSDLGPPVDEVGHTQMQMKDPDLYRARGIPMKISMKSINGGGLTVSEEYNPEFINRKTELTSTVNKKITLSDSPAIDSIILDSGNGSRMLLTNDPKTDSLAAGAIQIESQGPQKYLNKGSQTDVVVGPGGRELQLLNHANGIEWGGGSICGNVNIQSKWKDVNVFTQAQSGRIFIQCLRTDGTQQVIQIETKGTGGNIIIKAGGDITLNAQGGNLNINADQAIKMKTSRFSLDCDSIDIKSAGVINMDGSQINLANGANPDIVPLPTVPSTYEPLGVVVP